MCREGAWFELTVEVTSVGKHTKPTARFFYAHFYFWYLIYSDYTYFIFITWKVSQEAFFFLRFFEGYFFAKRLWLDIRVGCHDQLGRTAEEGSDADAFDRGVLCSWNRSRRKKNR